MSVAKVREQIGKRAEVLASVKESRGDMSLAEIGRRLGISRERVRQIARAGGSLARVRGKRQELVCAECGKMFTAVPWQIKRGRRFCSRQCAQRARGRRQELVCAQCGKVFTAAPWQIKRGRRFCSRQCAQQARWRNGRSPILVFRCESCGKTFARKAYELNRGRRTRFCSRECAGKWVGNNFGGGKARVPLVSLLK